MRGCTRHRQTRTGSRRVRGSRRNFPFLKVKGLGRRLIAAVCVHACTLEVSTPNTLLLDVFPRDRFQRTSGKLKPQQKHPQPHPKTASRSGYHRALQNCRYARRFSRHTEGGALTTVLPDPQPACCFAEHSWGTVWQCHQKQVVAVTGAMVGVSRREGQHFQSLEATAGQ